MAYYWRHIYSWTVLILNEAHSLVESSKPTSDYLPLIWDDGGIRDLDLHYTADPPSNKAMFQEEFFKTNFAPNQDFWLKIS